MIIDPTYKQFFYRLLVDTNTDELKKNVTAEQVSIIHTMPSIFVGSLVELKAKISETLKKIGKASEENDCLKIWNIPVEKKLTIEEIVSSEKEDLESTSASSDDELQSSPLKKSISLKEKYITQKKEIEKNEENESPKLKL